MPRVMEIVTPLGDDVLLFHGMSAREEMSRPFEYQLDLLSKKNDVSVDDILGKNVTIKLGLPEDQTRYFNGYVTRFAQGSMLRPLLPLPRDRASVAVVSDPHRRLPHLPGDEGSRHHQGGLRRSSVRRLQAGTDRHLQEVDLLRPVSRDRLQLRQPADGAGRHRLLLPPHRRPRHAGADGFDDQAHAGIRLREAVVHLSRTTGQAGQRAHSLVGFSARDPAWRLRARRLRSRAAERRAENEQAAAARLLAERLRGLRLSRDVRPEVGRRAVCVGPHRRVGDAVRISARGDQCARTRRSARCSTWSTTSATIRTANT